LQTKQINIHWGGMTALLLLIKLERFWDIYTKSNFYAIFCHLLFDNGRKM